jgi:hypothetical protein
MALKCFGNNMAVGHGGFMNSSNINSNVIKQTAILSKQHGFAMERFFPIYFPRIRLRPHVQVRKEAGVDHDT